MSKLDALKADAPDENVVSLVERMQEDLATRSTGATVGELWSVWEEEVAVRLSESSQHSATSVRRHVAHLDGNPAAAILRNDVARLRARLQRMPSTWNKLRTTCSQVWKHGQLCGLVPDGCNPWLAVPTLAERRREEYLTDEQLSRALDALDELFTLGRIRQTTRAAIYVIAYQGMRPGEVLKLRWTDLDLEAGTAALTQHKTSAKVGARTVQLCEQSLALIAELPRTCEWAFESPSKRGYPLKAIRKTWTTVLEHAGLPDTRLYILRHTFASKGLREGRTLYEIGTCLGHRKADTTMRYAHLDGAQQRQAVTAIADGIERARRTK